ncbi:ImmA/IrrE family metallo-endopeptidase [Leptotrichia wadei]|uniref:ImmA/IrrE family metallo-endopeptidase n=1 Tax=Leptotrichia wadei TaxID=157687 RepID=UPI0011BF0FCE
MKRKYIVINEKLDEYSKLVVLCHELGHAIYHSSKNKLLMKINFLIIIQSWKTKQMNLQQN